jgi:hypothetical protein
MPAAKDLTRESPRSPRERVGRYVIVGRTIDKCRASIAGTLGDYHTNCPLDHLLLDWKGIGWEAFRAEIVAGSTDDEVVRFLDENGIEKSAEEVDAWNECMVAFVPLDSAAMREWFMGARESMGFDPRTTTLFDYLDADDRATFE